MNEYVLINIICLECLRQQTSRQRYLHVNKGTSDGQTSQVLSVDKGVAALYPLIFIDERGLEYLEATPADVRTGKLHRNTLRHDSNLQPSCWEVPVTEGVLNSH